MLTLSPSTFSLAEGDRFPLKVEAQDPEGNPISDLPVVWKSSDSNVATVDGAGVVSAQKIGRAEITASLNTMSASVRVGVYSATRKGRLDGRLSGAAVYEDAVFTIDGLTGVVAPQPIPFAAIEVIRLFDFATIAQGITAADGTFSVALSNAAPAGVYLRVLTKSAAVEVLNNPKELSPYAVISEGLDDSVENSGLRLTASQQTVSGRAFNIFSALQQGAQTVSVVESSVPTAVAYWEPGGLGTFYENFEDRIYLSGSPLDPDENDDAVILHEYGHFLAHHFSRDDTPGGDHVITDHSQDIRLSWSEGWGNFFGSTARISPLYVDTNASGASRLSFDLETLASPVSPSLAEQALYTTSEIAVAAVLWDFLDPSPGEEADPVQISFSTLWRAFRSLGKDPFPLRTVSFELFWDTLRLQNPELAEGDLLTVTRRRQIDPAKGAAPGPLVAPFPQKHTLFPIDDVDTFPFTVGPGDWIVETRNLSNGADTYLEIVDGTGQQIAANDNRDGRRYSKDCGLNGFTGRSSCPPNDDATLSSLILLPVPTPGAFEARVRRSPDAPPSAGVYGTYEIRLCQDPCPK